MSNPLADTQTYEAKLAEAELEKLRLEIAELKNRNRWVNNLVKYIPLISVLVTVAGFGFGVYQFRSQQRDNLNRLLQERNIEIAKLKRQEIEKQLGGFYYPVLLRLKIDDVLWPKLSEMADAKLRKEIEGDIILPNQDELLKIILSNPDVMKEDEKLREQIFMFIKHSIIQKALRSTEQYNRDAVSEDEGWPYGFRPMIESKVALLQKRYDDCVVSVEQCR